jgi:CheY-like chemotaxis protein
MLPGGGTLTLRQEVVDLSRDSSRPLDLEAGVYVRLAISDTGRGMDGDVLSRIFEPFFTTKGPSEGTGLGLAVVHGIMRSHEGAVTVRSQPGEGTTFELYFPAREGEEAVEALPVDASQLMLGHGERVLLVDDEVALTQLGSRVLERLGYQVIAETDPVAALATLRAAPDGFDVLLTDLTMPTMSGLELLREVRQVRPDLPVVLATGYGGGLNQDQVRALGVRELLFKPATVVSLGAAMRRALGGEGVALGS